MAAMAHQLCALLVLAHAASASEFLGEGGLPDDAFHETTVTGHCPRGKIPVPKPDAHTMIDVNGCSHKDGGKDKTYHMSSYGLDQCCNVHDACYHVCGANKTWCDDDFWTCSWKRCKWQGEGGGKSTKAQSKECRKY